MWQSVKTGHEPVNNSVYLPVSSLLFVMYIRAFAEARLSQEIAQQAVG